ncbi:HAD family hydrolase [Leptothoe spongobia]|uniref:HAD family hydrolase n=1 Tax=Leptothoe spongobia TAU-MAC 1115 TaxID=1967444 RepID=A0A947DGS7_9CYAN|nr:HAD family hydrolase [Leptothoe spongobia]MBT9315651.1 HAD family hydrolase [Leptothoe spongobia TAU-MAC 1115]
MKFLIFDLDDTLFSEKEFVLSGFQAVEKWLSDSCQISGFYEVALNLFESGVRGNTFNLTLLKLGIAEDKSLIQNMIEVYRNHKPRLHLHEDAQWSIKRYQDKSLGLITDGFLQVQKNKVEALGLNTYLENIIYTDTYGRKNWKPSPLPYLEMMRMKDCPGSDLTYVGDNPKKDFITARQLGWQTVHLCRPDGEYSGVSVDKTHQADVQIESLYELSKLL